MNPELPLTDEPAAVFARMAGLLLSAETVDSVLRLVTKLAKETFPGTAGAGLSMVDPHGARVTTAPTDEVVEQADRIQYETGTGPLPAGVDRPHRGAGGRPRPGHPLAALGAPGARPGAAGVAERTAGRRGHQAGRAEG